MPPLSVSQTTFPLNTLLTPSQPPPASHSPHPGSQTSGPSWNLAPERAAASPPGSDRTRRSECGMGSGDDWEDQRTGPHLQKELPALGIIILLGENVAEAGEDSEAVPGGWRAAALRMGQARPHASSQPSAPIQCPILPTWLLPPRLLEACGWGWIAGPTQQHKLKRSFGADDTPVGVTEIGLSFGTSLHTRVPNRAKPLSYLCHADPLLQEPGPLGRTEWPNSHLPGPLSS